MCGRGCGEVWGGLGTVGGLACPKTLARTVEGKSEQLCFGDLGQVCCSETIQGLWNCGGPSGGLEQQPPTNSTSRLQHTAGQASGEVGSEQSLPESDLAKTIQGLGEGYPRLWNCGGSERGSGTTTPYKLHQQTPVHRRGGQRGGLLDHFGTIPASGPWRVRGGLWGSGYSGTCVELWFWFLWLKKARGKEGSRGRAGRGSGGVWRGLGAVWGVRVPQP